jgi:hypothetical protein
MVQDSTDSRAQQVSERPRPCSAPARVVGRRLPKHAVQRGPLTHAHISPPLTKHERGKVGNFTAWVDGSLVKVSKPQGYRPNPGGGKRGCVVGFSRASRRRMMHKMAMLCREELPLFVTLTYPAEFSPDYTQWKSDLDKFCKRLHRKYPQAGLIWRLEPQRRGAPHYHMMIFGLEFTGEARMWIARAWFEVVGSEDEKHLRHGTDMQMIRSVRGARSYVAKYLAKEQSTLPIVADPDASAVDWSKVGRWWGVRYAENLPWSETLGGDGLTFHEAAVCMRYLRRYLKGQGVKLSGSLPGLTVFVQDPRRWVDVLDRLLRES